MIFGFNPDLITILLYAVALTDTNRSIKLKGVSLDFFKLHFSSGCISITFSNEKKRKKISSIFKMETLPIILDGNTLSPKVLVDLQSFDTKIALSENAWEVVNKARDVIDRVLTDGRTVYGINTGFGKFCRVLVSPEKLVLLQNNLITSHSCGVGKPIDPKRARSLMGKVI